MKNEGAKLAQEVHWLELFTLESQTMLSANKLLPSNAGALCLLVEPSRSLTFVSPVHHNKNDRKCVSFETLMLTVLQKVESLILKIVS